ncbi:zinc ribbon domain-containing protein [Haloplanus halophilus]|uniref:zinc ribbon domain-containing protein n=1 Tax=Haloplanus halophilus TaxID=2949993 RepID=UPI00203F24B8|nr:zinc ribbon domain-containing protein [Haloplanus sp. GDY1]
MTHGTVAALAGTAAPTLGGAVERLALLVAFGALVVAALALQFAKVRALYGGDATDGDERVTCPACGARTAADAATCDYCGDPLGDGEGG